MSLQQQFLDDVLVRASALSVDAPDDLKKMARNADLQYANIFWLGSRGEEYLGVKIYNSQTEGEISYHGLSDLLDVKVLFDFQRGSVSEVRLNYIRQHDPGDETDYMQSTYAVRQSLRDLNQTPIEHAVPIFFGLIAEARLEHVVGLQAARNLRLYKNNTNLY